MSSPSVQGAGCRAVGEAAAAAVPSGPAGSGTLQIGARVLISGLVARADLNGRCGQILSHDEAVGRYTVAVDGAGPVAFKPANLSAEGAPPPHPPQAAAAPPPPPPQTQPQPQPHPQPQPPASPSAAAPPVASPAASPAAAQAMAMATQAAAKQQVRHVREAVALPCSSPTASTVTNPTVTNQPSPAAPLPPTSPQAAPLPVRHTAPSPPAPSPAEASTSSADGRGRGAAVASVAAGGRGLEGSSLALPRMAGGVASCMDPAPLNQRKIDRARSPSKGTEPLGGRGAVQQRCTTRAGLYPVPCTTRAGPMAGSVVRMRLLSSHPEEVAAAAAAAAEEEEDDVAVHALDDAGQASSATLREPPGPSRLDLEEEEGRELASRLDLEEEEGRELARLLEEELRTVREEASMREDLGAA